MGLFDKKYCSVCGNKIGLLGNRKLEDGNLCKECANKLSHWFNERRSSTVEQIKEQLEYRERNKEAVAAFSVTRTMGENYKILIDDNRGKFIVTNNNNWQNYNPDVLDFGMITGCETDVDETRHEEMREDKDGHKVSFNPPRYTYSYDFDVTIYVNHPYFDQIKFQYNSSSVEEGGPGAGRYHNMEYDSYVKKTNDLKDVLDSLRNGAVEAAAQAAKPRTQVTCIHCGAATIPDENGLCEYCGLPATK